MGCVGLLIPLLAFWPAYVYWPSNAPAKIKRRGHFGDLAGMWIFQNIILQRPINSAKSRAKIRLAFHFVERNNFSGIHMSQPTPPMSLSVPSFSLG